jgi:uroporphyrinogen-III synthase
LIQSVFISRDSENCGSLVSFCQSHQLNLISKSLIFFEPIDFQVSESYEVLFFSSIRSAEFFLYKEKIHTSKKIACVGRETALKLENLGLHIDFVGTNSGTPSEVAFEFKNWLGNGRVLIPHSSESLHTITEYLSQNQFILIEVYKTKLKSLKVPPVDCYVFTSPSNVRAFLSVNELAKMKNVVAWGRSTENELKSNQVPISKVLQTGSIQELEIYLSDNQNI